MTAPDSLVPAARDAESLTHPLPHPQAHAASGVIRLTSRHRVLLTAILFGHAVLAWFVRQRDIFTFGDDAAYLLLARSLRHLSYREVQFISEPIAARFPPGYPGLLAVITSIFGERLPPIAIVGILFSVVGLLALFDVVRRRWSPELGLAAVAVVAVNPTIVEVAGAPVTEATFISLTLCTLWAADRSDSDSSSRRFAILAGALAITAAFVRSAGTVLPLTLATYWLRRRNLTRVIAVSLASALTVGVWIAWTVVAPQREIRRSYVDDAILRTEGQPTLASTLAARVKANSEEYVGRSLLTELRLPLTAKTTLDNAGWVVLLAILVGTGLASAWRRWNVAVIFMVLYSGLLVVWPYSLERFLAPMLPVVITFGVLGGGYLTAWLGTKVRLPQREQLGAVLVGLLLATLALARDHQLVEVALDCDRTRVSCAPPARLDFVDAARFAATNTPDSARFIVPKNATLYYFSGRRSVFWEEVLLQDTTTFLGYLRRDRITHVLATPVYSDYRKVYQLVLHDCAYFDIARAYSPQTMVVAIRATPRDDGDAGPTCVAMRRALARKPVD